MSSLIAEILFENKEQIPDGLYLQLMNTLKIINDNELIPITLQPVIAVVRNQFFRMGVFKYIQLGTTRYFEIVFLTTNFLRIIQVYDMRGVGADGISGIKCSDFEMVRSRVKINIQDGIQQVILRSFNGFKVTIRATDLI